MPHSNGAVESTENEDPPMVHDSRERGGKISPAGFSQTPNCHTLSYTEVMPVGNIISQTPMH